MIESKKKEDIELHPDAWDRFERAAKVVAKSPPQHRESKPTKKKAAPKKRKAKS